MYHNIVGCRAEKLDNHNGQVAFSGNQEVEITFSPYVSIETLHDVIDKKLQKVETATQVNSVVLKELQQLVSLVPSDSVEKEEYESRLKSINSLYFVANEIENLITSKATTNEELLSKVNQMDALLKVSFHGPLRSLLEEKVNKVISAVETQSKEEVNAQNLVYFINNVQKSEDIDEILCELSVEDYINLGKKGREVVAKLLFELSKSYRSNEEVMDDLNRLITEFNKDAQQYQLCEEDEEVQLSNIEESHKQTLGIKEIEFLTSRS